MINDLTISIVTATYNSERFLPATIDSVLRQQYPALDYIVIDGGSTDNTCDIIRTHESHLSYWVSEPDNGMYDAIQKGFDHSTGEIMAWLNSDDMYLDWTLQTVAEIFRAFPDVDWITSIRPLIWDSQGRAVDAMAVDGYSKKTFLLGEHTPMISGYSLEVIQQESTFWRRSLWEKVGACLDTSLRYAGDFDLWARFYQHSNLVGVRTPLAGFRHHGQQLSHTHAESYSQEAQSVFERVGGKRASKWKQWQRRNLAPFFRHRLRKLGLQLGICYPSQIITYSPKQHWVYKQTII